MDDLLLTTDSDQRFMNSAYQEALKALDEGEVPIGAVVVLNGRIIGRGYNRMEHLGDATAHAEIVAISAASNSQETWRLDKCTLYVTLEPCIMCLGAILQSRIERIVYATRDERLGAIDSHFFRQELEHAYKRFPCIESGIMARECKDLLISFFTQMRKQEL